MPSALEVHRAALALQSKQHLDANFVRSEMAVLPRRFLEDIWRSLLWLAALPHDSPEQDHRRLVNMCDHEVELLKETCRFLYEHVSGSRVISTVLGRVMAACVALRAHGHAPEEDFRDEEWTSYATCHMAGYTPDAPLSFEIYKFEILELKIDEMQACVRFLEAFPNHHDNLGYQFILKPCLDLFHDWLPIVQKALHKLKRRT